MKRNDEIEVNIVDNGFQGEGIAKVDGYTVFIPEAISGEKVKIKVLKVAANIAYGKVMEIIEPSEYRIENDCETYSKCGGCNLRHMSYEHTLDIKMSSVKGTLRKQLGREVEIEKIIGMDKPYYYRNKLQYPLGIKDGAVTMGIFAERSHRIIETKRCMIQDELSQKIANGLFGYIKEHNISVYDESTQTGSIRHIVIRIGKNTREVMITIVSNTEKIQRVGNNKGNIEAELVKYITEKYPEIKTIVKNINSKNTNVILGYDRKNEVLYGDGYIEDYLGNLKFKISPMSFYQVNPIQTEKLYSKAVEYAGLSGKEVVFDLYCGIGTIGLFASQKANKVYGVETIADAIEDAKINAQINNIKNAEFYVGDVKKFLPKFIEEKKIHPDVIFIDPPRKGCDKEVIDTLLEISSKKIVYVSCNPATLARDLKLLEEKYRIEKITLVDMFPWTSHVESISILKLR